MCFRALDGPVAKQKSRAALSTMYEVKNLCQPLSFTTLLNELL